MADFSIAVAKTFNAEGGYQADPADTANYVKGVLIGTNHGISAIAYATYLKRTPTVDEMKALTQDTAKLIFKSLFWDKIAGDYITNQSVSQLMFQYVIGAGDEQISDLKDIANSTYGKPVLISNDVPFGKSEASFVNGLDQAKFFENMKTWRLHYYDLVVARSVTKWELTNKRKITDAEALQFTKKKFLAGWRHRLNTHIFSA